MDPTPRDWCIGCWHAVYTPNIASLNFDMFTTLHQGLQTVHKPSLLIPHCVDTQRFVHSLTVVKLLFGKSF